MSLGSGLPGESPTGDVLARDPHEALARMRSEGPVAWVPDWRAWLVTGRDLCIEVLTDAGTFTVDDDRFSTRRVVGPSMLSRDGDEHRRHRSPFGPAYRARAVRERLGDYVVEECRRLIGELRPRGGGDLRSSFAAPLAALVMTRALGLHGVDVADLLDWNRRITEAIDRVTIGDPVPDDGLRAMEELRVAVARSIAEGGELAEVHRRGDLALDELAADLAVLLIGGVVTSEGAVAICLQHLLSDPATLRRVSNDPTLVERAVAESMRLEPAAAFLDRYATREVTLGRAPIGAGDLVRVSVSAANRDPGTFEDPHRFDIDRPNADEHIAFARGPHACLGIHVARLETRVAVEHAVVGLPGLDGAGQLPDVEGLIFRSPPAVPATWR